MDQHKIKTVFAVVTFYCSVSITMVFLNKYLLSYSKIRPGPIFMTWLQSIGTSVILYFVGEAGKTNPLFDFIPPFKIEFERCKKIFKLSFVFAAMIIFGNYCLKHVAASFFVIARSMHIVFNVSLSYFLLGQKTDFSIIKACIIVTLGYILGSVGEVKFSWQGFVFGLIASFLSALYPIVMKQSLENKEDENNPNEEEEKKKFSNGELMIYNNTLAIGLLFPFVLLSEEISVEKIKEYFSFSFILLILISTSLAFLLSFATVLQVKHTSPLTHMIVGSLKGSLQTVLGALLFGNEVSLLNAIGVILCIGGSFIYAYLRKIKQETKVVTNPLPKIKV
ncbi:solute carrier family 35 [Anaeramoeba ignava]|uniref:Solute carrier family 35 n=1 Tax=Anaeramoeba ignava TaxID=1746090 RepID=A0A9Q0RF29_ANAIG|nr:solute carrier family 35 [Anaeramoeba ignava]